MPLRIATGTSRTLRSRSGEPIDWPDAWAAACAIWLDVPLVTHDRDLEGIPGLRILMAHTRWCVREGGSEAHESGILWLDESPLRLRADAQ